MRRFVLFAIIVILLPACRPASPDVGPLPTLIPSPTPRIDMTAAQRTALTFLDAWQREDFELMYRLTTTPTQDATPYDTFAALYNDAHNTMTLEALTYTPHSLLRTGMRMVSLGYDVTFETQVLGTFADADRTLTLVIDPRTDQWRVAWSLGDIFREMGGGATLRFEGNPPGRANIYDRHGQVLADQNGRIVDIWVIKADIPAWDVCLALLAEAVNRPIEAIQDLLARSGDDWTVRVGTMEPPAYSTQSDQLQRECNASGRGRAVRQYPRGSLMPHVLGHVGYPEPDEVDALVRAGFNAETIIGRSGIEASWDDVLRGVPGGRLSLVAPTGQRLRTLADVQQTISESLWLTLDADLQEYVLRTLGEAYVRNADSWARTSRGGAAIVLAIETGEVLALVSYPTFEGNALNPFPVVGRAVADDVLQSLADDPARPQLNRVTQGRYPAGSTMKVVDAVAVQDSGIYSPDESYVCTGSWTYEDDTRYDWWAPGHGRLDTARALTHSCNPFFYEVGFLLNQTDPFLLPSYARRMGLGVPTGLTDIAETSGRIPDPDWVRVNRGLPWTYSDAVNMAIGQGEMEVTPLQMARMYAAIANDGTLYRPQIVRERGILDQRTFVAEPDPMSTLDVAPHVLPLVREGLCDVTVGNGTAAHIFRYSPLLSLGVCGKTGTAQSAGNRPPHSWFIAYAPAQNPEVVAAVMIENAGEGSAIAAPLTKQILEYYFFGPFD